MPLEKRAVIQGLHAMMVTRLFGGRPWLADRETCDALRRKLCELSLEEPVSDENHTTRPTALGNELLLELVMVFIGLWDEWEIPWILEDHGLIDEIDADRIVALLETSNDPERLLRPIVLKAYRKYYNPSGLLN
ncbi:MAG: hypothetical protein HKN28_17730 [Alphaproteobacteria bacterium]|nr:hypothetical protein [Alphaproteobacteria bacterium]